MKIQIYNAFTFLLIGMSILFTNCGQQTTNSEKMINELSVHDTYVCPMRCTNSQSNEPGKCQVCNMMLVKAIELDSISDAKHLSNQSIYTTDYDWTDQNSTKVNLNNYAGKYQLISMIFTHCDYACPNLIGDMLNIDDRIIEVKKEDLNFILVSIDPERDTPKQLAAYANDLDLNMNRWSLLNGDVNAVNDISSKLGISYKKFENGAFGHSNIISLLNKNGEIIYQLEGIHANRIELVNIINSL